MDRTKEALLEACSLMLQSIDALYKGRYEAARMLNGFAERKILEEVEKRKEDKDNVCL